MTIETICEQYGISRTTVYRRLKAAGVSPDALRDAVTGELTEHGIQCICGLLDSKKGNGGGVTRNTDSDNCNTENYYAAYVAKCAELEQVKQELETARQQIIILQAEAAERSERYAKTVEEHAKQLAQIAQGQQRLLADRERRGWFGWFRRRDE